MYILASYGWAWCTWFSDVGLFGQIFREENGAWLVPVVTQTAEALRLLANKADEQLLSNRQEQCRKEAAGSWLQKFYATAKTVKGMPHLPSPSLEPDRLSNTNLSPANPPPPPPLLPQGGSQMVSRSFKSAALASDSLDEAESSCFYDCPAFPDRPWGLVGATIVTRADLSHCM